MKSEAKMKRLLLFLFGMLFIGIPLAFGQSWETEIDFNLNPNADFRDEYDLYSNVDGNHIILYEDDEINYYLFNSSGSQIRSSTIVTGINQPGSFAKIDGFGQYVYIVYANNDTIFTRRSTDAGQSWSTSVEDIAMANGDGNGLEVCATSTDLHITWSEYDDSDDEYDTYHNQIEHNGNSWGTKKRVTDSSGDYGGFPSITTSSNRVHVAYTQSDDYSTSTSFGELKTRDKYYSTWQTPQTQDNSGNAMVSFVIADNSKLHCLYYVAAGGMGQYQSDLYAKNRTLGSTTWSSATLLKEWADVSVSVVDLALDSGNLVVTYSDDYQDIYIRKYISSWGSETDIGDGKMPRISTDYHDIYVIWTKYDSPDNILVMRQYNSYPPAPTLSINTSGENPILSWNKTSLDAKEYKVYRKVVGIQDWHYKTTTSNLSWTDTGVYLEYPLMTIYYRIQAVDQEDNISGWSNEVTCSGDALNKPYAQGLNGIKTNQIPDAFILKQNYPNPFNPSTTIGFDLPEANHVRLIVFDISGKQVRTLVDEYVSAGTYEFNFSAYALPSGIYFYRLNAGKFSDYKRMLVIK